LLHSPQGPPSLAQWSAYLRHLAGEAATTRLTLEETRAFRDDRGHHRACDLPFLAQRFGHEVGPAPETADYDVALWWALHDASVDVDRVIDKNAQPHTPDDTLRGGQGGLFLQGLFQTIEVWTEADLSGLHALYHLAQRRDRPDWRERLFEIARWHLLEVQPDNGTNHPWAVHVFLILAREEDDAQAQLHAETLLNNTLVTFGKPDAFSRQILADAAVALDAYAAGL
jgi:hypothetical protein